jgi:hypothetical protein
LSRLTTQHPDSLSPTNAPCTTIGYLVGDAIASLKLCFRRISIYFPISRFLLLIYEAPFVCSHLSAQNYLSILYSEYFPCVNPLPREGNLQLTASEGHLNLLGHWENPPEFRTRVVPQQLFSELMNLRIFERATPRSPTRTPRSPRVVEVSSQDSPDHQLSRRATRTNRDCRILGQCEVLQKELNRRPPC